jgi:hypothetical protein
MDRQHWSRRISQLDPGRDYEQIYRILATHEFPWDMNQSLSFALYRTYAVPSIGRLLAETGEFTRRTQKRYDDTTLILDTILEHGLASPAGRTAVRRMNQMHGAYDISNADKLYVLCAFVVMPIRWIGKYGWRHLTATERAASANYYRELGRHMGIKDIPATEQEFAAFLDAYEREHFGFDEGALAVSEATLQLMATFPAGPESRDGPIRQGADGRPAAGRLPVPPARPLGTGPGHGSAAPARVDGEIPARSPRAALCAPAAEHPQLPAGLRRGPAGHLSPGVPGAARGVTSGRSSGGAGRGRTRRAAVPQPRRPGPRCRWHDPRRAGAGIA